MNVHLPLDMLQRANSLSDDPVGSAKHKQVLEEVGTQFESVFLSMMVSTMRESTEGGMFEGEGSDTLGGMFDMFMGQHLAEAGGVGIKQMLVARYAANKLPEPEGSPNES